MTGRSDTERFLDAFLAPEAEQLSDRVLEAALSDIARTPQRRALRVPWRFTNMPVMYRAAAAALALVVLAGAGGVIYLNSGGFVGGPKPTVRDFPNLTKTFVSPRNGFSVKHPDRVALTPAKQLWGWSKQVDDGFDVVETGLAAVFKGASTRIPETYASIDEYWDDYVADDESMTPGGCGVPRDQQAEITIDGQSGRVSQCPNEIEATVGADGRLYLFTLLHDRRDARAVFDALAATIDLTPETAIDYPALTTTFVSPTYGYSFGSFRGVEPATERWDPGNQPLDDRNFDPRFDAMETGLSAYFEAASTPIPDGVSIDDWVDKYVTPLAAGGCGVPRSQQAEITIDGQPGRTAECPNQVEATVVAGGRLYLFMLGNVRSDARAFFDSWIATIDLRPEDAAVPSSTPSS